MSQALEQFVSEQQDRGMTLFTRGPEIEITTYQDVEMLKAMLAQNKIHINARAIERGIVMPRDLDNNHPGYPKVADGLMLNPYKREKETKKKKKKDTKGDKKTADKKQIHALQKNKKGEYKVAEFGNFPLNNEGKPKMGVWRMMLPCDADWEVTKPEAEDKEEKAGGGIAKIGGKITKKKK